jgi:uncharacterized membrane protein YhhN
VVETVLTAVILGAVASLLVAVRAGDQALRVVSKTAASASFVAIGVARWQAGDPVDSWLVGGLVLCALGDLLLIGDGTFDAGLLAFVLGHLAYIASFATALAPAAWPIAVILPLAVVAAVVVRWLWPRLGRRRLPVAVYVAVISVMVWGAIAAAAAGALPWTAAAGAALFYLSDLTVARERFVRSEFINRAAGLPLYYAGQVLIALAV